MNLSTHLRHPDRIFALVTIALAAVMYSIAGTLAPPVNPGEISASTYPKVILLCIIGMCCIVLARPEEKEQTGAVSFRGVPVGLLCAVYIALIEPVGFFIVTPVFLFLLPWLVGFRRHLLNLVSVAVNMAFVYLVFVKALSIPLPPGLLGD